MQRHDGAEWSADALTRRAERWRPWRAYAAQHLWAADAAHATARESRGAEPHPRPNVRER
jgi:AraC family transcriptional regulator, regulatory protein of adaptative response / DNA-3-methyladenine glycosylase II